MVLGITPNTKFVYSLTYIIHGIAVNNIGLLYEKMNVGNKYHHRNMKKSNIANVWTCRIAGQHNKIFV